MKTKLSDITMVLTITSILSLTGCSRARAPEDKPATGDELTTLKREYADVLALQGTSKGETAREPGLRGVQVNKIRACFADQPVEATCLIW